MSGITRRDVEECLVRLKVERAGLPPPPPWGDTLTVIQDGWEALLRAADLLARNHRDLCMCFEPDWRGKACETQLWLTEFNR